MNPANEKCVMILDERLSSGIVANVAAILGVTLGQRRPEVVGMDVTDGSGSLHAGIIQFPIPILRASAEQLRSIRERLDGSLTALDFSDLAQNCRTYAEYIARMADVSEQQLNYLGLALCGDRKRINKLTGNLPLLR
ncbi:MAG: DUF2000 domain-containing protein [Clostridia bacterium]|nr:DUF2000 domain-containing protein [Clostridia bacterium]